MALSDPNWLLLYVSTLTTLFTFYILLCKILQKAEENPKIPKPVIYNLSFEGFRYKVMANWPLIRNRASCFLSIGCRRLVLSRRMWIKSNFFENSIWFFFSFFLVELWQRTVSLWNTEDLLESLESPKHNFWIRLWQRMLTSGRV